MGQGSPRCFPLSLREPQAADATSPLLWARENVLSPCFLSGKRDSLLEPWSRSRESSQS